MDLLKKLKAEQELEKESLNQRTLLSDAELIELEEQIQYEAAQKLAEHAIFIKEVEDDIEIARQYLSINSWRKALEILKHRFDDSKTPTDLQHEVHTLYREAEAMMEAARKLDPTVKRFTHFNLPTDDAN